MKLYGWDCVVEGDAWLHTLFFETEKGKTLIKDDSDYIEVWGDGMTPKEAAELWAFWRMGTSEFPSTKGCSVEGVPKNHAHHIEGKVIIWEGSGEKFSEMS